MSLEEVKSLVLALTPEDQLRLMDDISESLDTAYAAGELTDEQRAELDRRIAETDANPDSFLTLDEVKRRLSKYT
ncbi:MAG: addiction module protein [Planctomycetes bacterium]|nr:addiction module protein [Planctomycetota bacterium]